MMINLWQVKFPPDSEVLYEQKKDNECSDHIPKQNTSFFVLYDFF